MPGDGAERIRIEVANGVADVVLDRPDKMNALDPAMFDALGRIGERLAAIDDLRAVVLSGAGRAFCAGLDLASFGAGEIAADLMARTHSVANRFQHAAMVWRTLPVPVIAAVRGVAFGGGFQIMLGADIRYAAPEASFSMMEIKWGIVPDMGGTVLMAELARADILRELAYTGRVFSAAEAVTFGFVTRLETDPHAAALATARTIAGRSPDAVRAAKRLLCGPIAGAAAALLRESAEQAALIGAANQREAVQANFEKRAPVFRPAGAETRP